MFSQLKSKRNIETPTILFTKDKICHGNYKVDGDSCQTLGTYVGLGSEQGEVGFKEEEKEFRTLGITADPLLSGPGAKKHRCFACFAWTAIDQTHSAIHSKL